jgi:hypothetical protein
MTSRFNNPFADPDHPIDYGLRGRDIKLGPVKARPKPPEQPEPGKSGIVALSYKNLEFEPLAPSKGTGIKEAFYFNDSLARLRDAGYQRHPSPSEAFGLIIDGLEGKLGPGEKTVADDMLESYGEWFSMAYERKGDTLVAYLEPEGLVWDSGASSYVKQGFKFSDKRKFGVAGKASRTLIELSEFDDDFVRFHYGRPFKDLPTVVQEGDQRAQVWLREGGPWPVGRGVFVDDWFVVNGGCDGGASRGVRPKR